MNKDIFAKKIVQLKTEYEALINRKNMELPGGNGIIQRYKYPVITAGHTPYYWRYDLNPERNPYLLERMGINSAFNTGAIEMNGMVYLVVRVEGVDRKSFFAVAESENGIDNFRFWDYPIDMPETDQPETNLYDMRLTRHEDGWIYGVFCSETKDPNSPAGNESAAVARAGIARTKDLKTWQRLPNLKTKSSQQRNVVLHPEFIKGKYAFYTRPQDSFIKTGSGGGIGWALCDDIENPVIQNEMILDAKKYHTIKEEKNGQGPAPIKTDKGWLHLAHGVRNTASGLRYVLYIFMSDLDDPSRITRRPGGYFMAPVGDEWIGDVYNVLFANGWVKRDNGDVLIYYCSGDTRVHVAKSQLDVLVDYVMNTPPDGENSSVCVKQRIDLIDRNMKQMAK